MSEIVLAGDFNIHNATWLRHSNKTSNEGRYVEIFSEENLLTQLVLEPTHIPDVTNHAANTLDLFLTSHLEKYKIEVSAPLGSSDHSLVSALFSSAQEVSKEKLLKRKIWFYRRANWDGLTNYFQNYKWSQCFKCKDVNFFKSYNRRYGRVYSFSSSSDQTKKGRMV